MPQAIHGANAPNSCRRQFIFCAPAALIGAGFGVFRRKNRSRGGSGPLLKADNYRAFLAVSTRAANAVGSAMAISDRALRFRSILAFFRPFMKRE